MAPNKLENVAQCCFNKFNWRLFISTFSQFAFYFYLALSVISESLTQPCCKCCSLSALWWMCDSPRKRCVWWTTPMCRQQAEIKWARRGFFSLACCHSVKLCALVARPFQSQQMLLSWGCEGGARCNFHKMNVQWVRFIAKTSGCCCHFSVGVALTVWFSFGQYRKMTRDEHVGYLDLNLATFQHIDGFWCYHFCLSTFGLELVIFFWTSSHLSVQFWDCRLL